MNSRETHRQIIALTNALVERSLCDEQVYPSVRKLGAKTVVSISGLPDFATQLKDVSYSEIYEGIEAARAFNFRMLDGGFVQLLYEFGDQGLSAHRLAYFPSPSLEPFQNDPEVYENDEIYADIIKKSVVPFPVRFDYSDSDERHIEVDHPKSHLTLGQYQNCRIPVEAPLSPSVFVKFILRNFYSTAFSVNDCDVGVPDTYFDTSIVGGELRVPHLVLGAG